jgi:regulator of vacuolar morphogenesis
MPDAELSTELEAAKLRLQAKLQSDTTPEVTDEKDQVEPRDSVQQAQVLLDMIITIVGEFFGQRDLLDAREVWIRDEAVDEM